MPSLLPKDVHEFWKQYPDPMIYRVIMFMEAVEPYLERNEPEFVATLEKLGRELDDISAVNFNDFSEKDLIIAIANQFKTGSALRFLHIMDTVHPGCASRLLMYAEENSLGEDDNNGLFLRRNVVFERLRLMARVLSPERFALVRKALEGNSYDA
ncbi:MAG: icmW [Gammaproteobacteria bacterium]|jgi:intracellular multiplication protein IcmW|nr:icmW [Gammaproteobacteria bacterium]